MTLSPSQNGARLDLIAAIKGLAAAENYFNSRQLGAKNQSTYRKLLKWYYRELKEDKAKALFQEMDHLQLVNTFLPFMDMMNLFMGLLQPEKVEKLVYEMDRRDIDLNLACYVIWAKNYVATDDEVRIEDVFLHTDFNSIPIQPTFAALALLDDSGIVVPH